MIVSIYRGETKKQSGGFGKISPNHLRTQIPRCLRFRIVQKIIAKSSQRLCYQELETNAVPVGVPATGVLTSAD